MRYPVLAFIAVLATAAAMFYWQGSRPQSRNGPPRGFPTIEYPANNPQTSEKIELGRHLFYERRLSVNNTVACADCHQQRHAFADVKRYSIGPTGDATKRNTMSLTNVAYNARFTWASDAVRTLEQQAVVPLTLEHPLEMGFQIKQKEALGWLQQDAYYPAAFRKAFPEQEYPFSLENIAKAIASFERILISSDSPYDRNVFNHDALSDSVKRGFVLFYSNRLGCVRCHNGFNFRHSMNHRAGPNDKSVAFHNTGLYNLDGKGGYPPADQGLFEMTGDPKDMGRFKTPTLRNIAVTAPYMHDGSIASLEEVIEHYARGGRQILSGTNQGDGRDNPYKSPFVSGFAISPEEKQDLIEFLQSLTDQAFLTNPAFADPFTTGNGQTKLTDP